MHRSQGPRLKNGTDIQLQTAFQDGNWATAIRLAEKRAKVSGDEYFQVRQAQGVFLLYSKSNMEANPTLQIVKLCAESMLDEPTAKLAAMAAVHKYVQDGTVIKDAEGIDLLEWATMSLMPEREFADTLGQLRVRAAKASPKDHAAVYKCLESCLLHWDLVGAQQIAALMDRSFPQQRNYMFWNIVTTHMLATSPQAPEDKKKLYSMLAQKQIERAAQLSEQAKEAGAEMPARGIQTEQEVLLLYDVVQKHGTADDYAKLLASPVYNPAEQFRQGRKEVFTVAAAKHRDDGNWKALFDLCQNCLSYVDETEQISMLASDWLVWKQYLEAANHVKESREDVQDAVRGLLLKVLKSENMKPIYRRNVLLARVQAAFVLSTADEPDVADGVPSSIRFKELLHYVDDQVESPACFDDVRLWVETLDVEAMDYIAHKHLSSTGAGSFRKQLLGLKFQFLLSSSPKVVSDSKAVRQIFDSARELHSTVVASAETLKPADEAVTAELAILMAFCLVDQVKDSSVDSLQILLQALIILDRQLSLTPGDSQVSLILLQVHMLFGSAHEALEVWEPLAVKRMILDSLGPLFYDRLSTICPTLLSVEDHTGWQMVSTFKGAYENSLRLRMPHRLMDAFSSNSYISVISVPRYMEKLRFGCTRMMSLVEEARTERFFNRTYGELVDDSRYTDIADDMELAVATDYGTYPTLADSTVAPIYKALALGPAVSSNRMHLSRLTEAFHDAFSYKPPTMYKVTMGVAYDEPYILETLAELANSFAKFLPDAHSTCTLQEQQHFELVALLCNIITLATSRSPSLVDILPQLASAVTSTLEGQWEHIDSESSSRPAQKTAWRLRSLHAVAMLRDSAAAVTTSCKWLTMFNDRMKEKDRSGQSNVPKEVMASIKAMQAASATVASKGQRLIGEMRQDVGIVKGDLKAWLAEGNYGKDVLAFAGNDKALEKLVASWTKNLKGWQGVVWE